MKSLSLKTLLVSIAAILALVAMTANVVSFNTKKRDIHGSWVSDTEGNITGFQCGKGGIAATLNNDTLQYSSWQLHKGYLILNGKTFSDGKVTGVSDTFRIVSLTPTDLVATLHSNTIYYKKTR